tara:strand:- start:2609 stop:2884 length:276 start_codon:yes stop_codon:yes gene_type:complete
MKLDYSSSLKLRALIRKYEFERDEAIANLQIYFENAVGVGEHGSIVDEMDRLITILSDAEGKLKTTITYFANLEAPAAPPVVEKKSGKTTK